MTLCSLVLATSLSALPALAQDREPLVYITTLSESEIARETVELTESGWSAEVSVDIPGQQAQFRATLSRTDGGVEWRLDILPKTDESAVVVATITGRNLKLEIQPHGIEREREIEGPEFFMYENLCWACWIEVGRVLVPRAASGELELPMTLTPVVAQTETPLKLEVTQVEALDDGHWRCSTVFTGGLEIVVTFDGEGLPALIEVPAQKIVVTREGSGLERTANEGWSVVDMGPWRAQLSAPEHELVREENVRVPLSDGVHLATDIARPKGEGPFPTILMRTPYGRAGSMLVDGDRFARRGYAVVAQDVRGRFDSEGVFKPLHQETADAKDVLDWLVEQPWCDGNVGMIGGSYVGVVQWYAAATKHPALKAIIPQVSPPDPDENFPYEGGVMLIGTAWWAKVLQTMTDAGGPALPQNVKWSELMQTLPLGDLDDALEVSQPFLDEWLSHAPDDEEYWAGARYQPRIPEMDVAVLNVTGWFDGDQPGALQNFPLMQSGAKSERARASQYLIVGPWGHGFNAKRKLGDVDFGPTGVIDMQAVEVRFFDHYLKGIENGIEDEDPVWIFVMGENRWRRETTWPLPQTQYTKLFFGSGGDATKWDGDGLLGPVAGEVGTTDADSLRYDPSDPPSIPDEMWTDVAGDSATMDIRQLGDRIDSLDYTSPPLAGPVELTGPVEVHLWGTTTADDADWVASLNVVKHDGRLRRLCSGVQRVRYRTGTDDPVAPGEVAHVIIDCWATSVRLEAGERLHVEIAPTAFPGAARNLGTLESPLTATEFVVSTNRILHDSEHPSHIVLPVVPRPGAPGLQFASEEKR